jgi:hypothetical protein
MDGPRPQGDEAPPPCDVPVSQRFVDGCMLQMWADLAGLLWRPSTWARCVIRTDGSNACSDVEGTRGREAHVRPNGLTSLPQHQPGVCRVWTPRAGAGDAGQSPTPLGDPLHCRSESRRPGPSISQHEASESLTPQYQLVQRVRGTTWKRRSNRFDSARASRLTASLWRW